VVAVDFLKRQALSEPDLAKIAHLNAERVLGL
jgi:predicted TIM-barrel fold metal-dependent hydrolase